MPELAQRIVEAEVAPNSVAIFWLGQAGFVYKTPAGVIAYVDPYLSECVQRLHGFKRIMPAPIQPNEVEADWVVSTHSHEDHLDVDAIPVMALNQRVHFVGAPDCRRQYEALGLSLERFSILRVGQELAVGDLRLKAVPADHGELAPEAIGVILQVGDIRIWQVGDSAYRPDRWLDIYRAGVDILVPPINGAFGNLGPLEAAKLAQDVGAKVVIPCHFWMFAEHNGDPAAFLAACKLCAPQASAVLLSVGELFVYNG